MRLTGVLLGCFEQVRLPARLPGASARSVPLPHGQLSGHSRSFGSERSTDGGKAAPPIPIIALADVVLRVNGTLKSSSVHYCVCQNQLFTFICSSLLFSAICLVLRVTLLDALCLAQGLCALWKGRALWSRQSPL